MKGPTMSITHQAAHAIPASVSLNLWYKQKHVRSITKAFGKVYKVLAIAHVCKAVYTHVLRAFDFVVNQQQRLIAEQ